jgi:hypothetical protein
LKFPNQLNNPELLRKILEATIQIIGLIDFMAPNDKVDMNDEL